MQIHPRTRKLIGWLGLPLALLLIGSGLAIVDTTQWRLQLVVGLWLLSLLPRALITTQGTVVTHGIMRLALVLTLGFSAVALQLTRNQISQAQDIRSRAVALLEPTPATADTPVAVQPIQPADRTSLGSGQVWPVEIARSQRGAILDSSGAVLASTQDDQRVYPNPELGHIVGFQSGLYGLSGVEASFDTYLSGERSLTAAKVLQAHLLEKTIDTTAAEVRLTLNSNLQQAAQEALGARPGAVVLLDPRSGAILALATYPRFDPNQLVLPQPATEADLARVREVWDVLTNRPDSPLLNRATQGRYPPGSILKTLTAAVALDSGVLEFPESMITCPNRLPTETGAPPVRNAVEGLSGWTGDPSDLRRVYTWSCNTAFAQIGLLLGYDMFVEYTDRFGLGFASNPDRASPLRDIAADAGSIANDPDFLRRPAALADTAFGQGQALVTPLDMAQMVAVIANDGKLMRPYVVQEARAGEQVFYTAQPEVLRQVISPASAERMRSIMGTSVERGYAAPAALPGIAIGGKTGTAEVPGAAPHSWFVAIAPLDNPRLAISVVVENGGEGSLTALPVARQVLAAALAQ